MAKNLQEYERRRHARYGVGSLVVIVNREGFLNQLFPPLHATALDFNQFGISIRCKKRLRDGEKVTLTLISLEGEIENLPATICHIAKAGRQFRYGIKFTYSKENPPSPFIKESLLALEGELKQTKIISS